jgi:hypothetical protein
MNTKGMINKIWSAVGRGEAWFWTEIGLREVKSIRSMYGKALSCTLSTGQLVTLNENNVAELWPKFVFSEG